MKKSDKAILGKYRELPKFMAKLHADEIVEHNRKATESILSEIITHNGTHQDRVNPNGLRIEFDKEAVRSEMQESRKRHTKKVRSQLP